MQHYQTFRKEERLCSVIHINKLFLEGFSFFVYPFRITYLKSQPTDVSAVKVLFSVSKKRFKHAVDRNRIKRILRESYRLKKPVLYDFMQNKQISVHLAFVYTESAILSYSDIEKKMEKAIQAIIQQLSI